MPLSRRIKDQILDFVPLIFVIGDKEEKEQSISIRKADGKIESVLLENIKNWLKNKGYFNHSLL